jgi:Arc/MetJ family transcription regulator
MPTNLAIDDKLLNRALKIGGHKTKKETVNEALLEYIQRRQQKEIIQFFGKVEFERDYDYKAGRSRK